MSLETRHKEKEILFKLLRLEESIRNTKQVKELIGELIATMEPEDVELVKNQVKNLEADE